MVYVSFRFTHSMIYFPVRNDLVRKHTPFLDVYQVDKPVIYTIPWMYGP